MNRSSFHGRRLDSTIATVAMVAALIATPVLGPPNFIFADGFEAGDATARSAVTP